MLVKVKARTFKVMTSTKLGKVFRAYAYKESVKLSLLRFKLGSKTLEAEDTLESLGYALPPTPTNDFDDNWMQPQDYVMPVCYIGVEEDRGGAAMIAARVLPSPRPPPARQSTAGYRRSQLKLTRAPHNHGSVAGGSMRPAPRRKPNYNSYSAYIYRVLKQVHPQSGISKKAMAIMDSLIKESFERIASESGRLCKYSNKATLSSREIQTAVRLILPGQLAKHAVSEGTKAVTAFTAPAN